MGKVWVCGAAALQIDYAGKTMTVDGATYKEGDYLSINGTAGEVYAGQIPTAASEIVQVLIERSLDAGKSPTYQNFKKLMDWCQSHAHERPDQCRYARADRARSCLRSQRHRSVPHGAHVL